MLKRYKCGFCETSPDQISHHKSHLQTQKHGDKKKIFELSLLKYSETELKEKYGTNEHKLIVENIETDISIHTNIPIIFFISIPLLKYPL